MASGFAFGCAESSSMQVLVKCDSQWATIFMLAHGFKEASPDAYSTEIGTQVRTLFSSKHHGDKPMGQHNRKSQEETLDWESHFTNTCIEELNSVFSATKRKARGHHTTKEANHHAPLRRRYFLYIINGLYFRLEDSFLKKQAFSSL